MSKTNFSKKCEIIGNMWMFYKDTDDEGWQTFFGWADLGCPLAYFVWQGMATAKPESKKLVEDTWDVFCDMLSVDADGSYDNLREVFDASPNPIIK